MADAVLLDEIEANDAAAHVGAWLAGKGCHRRFVDEMLDPLLTESAHAGVHPYGIVAQAYHETDGGRFTGAVRSSMRNTCGLRVEPGALDVYSAAATLAPHSDQVVVDALLTLSHASFATWWLAARAQVQHVLAYAGVGVSWQDLVDPRYRLVRRMVGTQALVTWRQLGQRWATDTYGDKLQADIDEIEGAL